MKSQKSYKGSLKQMLEQDKKLKNLMEHLPDNISKHAVAEVLPKNATLIMKHEAIEHAYMVMEGELQVRSEFADGNIYQFSTMGAGAFIADLEVLSGKYVNAVTVIAAKETLVIRFPIDVFEKELKTNIDFLYEVASSLARKMFASSYGRGKNLYKSCLHKVIQFLISYYETHNSETEQVKVSKNREEISTILGTTIRSVNRSVSELKEMEMLTIIKGKIWIDKQQYLTLIEKLEAEI